MPPDPSDPPTDTPSPSASTGPGGGGDADPEPLDIVGLGASAGGLEALSLLLKQVPVGSSLAWVIVSHLAPDHDTLLHDILNKRADIPVVLVTQEMELQAGCGYVIPPGQEMIVSGGRLLLTARDPAEVPNLPIDVFFQSLASELGARACAVVLSGTGRDGSRGVTHVHDAGGYVVVQSRDEARFDAMPSAALDTGTVDEELPASEIAMAVESRRRATEGVAADDIAVHNTLYARIFRVLRAQVSVDFSQYKLSTVTRRVQRRIADNRLDDLRAYADFLEEHPDEVQALYADLLIGVTSFFRDPVAFERLQEELVAYLRRDDVAPDRELRAWCVACATGEEAYTLAICFTEAFRALDEEPRFRLFATDVHHGCLEAASQGRYPAAAVRQTDPALVERYFHVDDEEVVVDAELRDRIVFANHDVTRDPPFTRMDLVSCRNLLIYFRPPTQRRVMTLFHFALRNKGLLLLGPSETNRPLDDEFTTIDRSWRLYRKRRDVRLHPDFRLPSELRAPVGRRSEKNPRSTLLDSTRRQLIEDHAPAAILVDPDGHIQHTFSGASRFLSMPDGAPTTQLVDLLEGDLRNAVAAALKSCHRDSDGVSYRGVRQGDEVVDVHARVIRPAGSADHGVLVTLGHRREAVLEDLSEVVDTEDLAAQRVRQLEADLSETRENLQTVLEEMEASNEELQATNEELLASNEELQSTNEELNSVNEELHSVNEEYQGKIVELQQMSSDTEHILRAGNIMVLFLDDNLRIRRFTPGVRAAFGLVDHDLGRDHRLFTSQLEGTGWRDKLDQTLQDEVPHSEEVVGPDGIPYQVRLVPYEEGPRRIRGVVVVLSDLREVKQAEAERMLLARMVEVSSDFIAAIDDTGRLVRVNQGARELLQRYGVSDVASLRDLLTPDAYERAIAPVLNAGGDGHWRGRTTLQVGPNGRVPVAMAVESTEIHPREDLYTVVAHDITDLQLAEDELRRRDRNKDRFLASLSHELRNPAAALFRAVELLGREDGDERHQRALGVARRQLDQLQRLLDDLLDASRIAAGRLELADEAVDLAAVVRAAVDTLTHVHTGVEVQLDLDVASPLVEGDAARLEQVVLNLLTNAAKYGGGEPVEVELRRDDGELVLCVRDHGVGLEPDDVEHIFDRFYRSERGEAAGVGIGLTLVRDLVSRHGGRVDVYSDGQDKGCLFTVVLPALEPSSEVSAGQAPEPTPAPGRRGAPAAPDGGNGASDGPLRVLVVDDNADAADALCMALELDGHDVVVGYTLRQARERLDGEPFDVALVDLQLPDGTGWDLAEELSGTPRRPERLVACSGRSQAADKERSRQAGFDLHLVKPVGLDRLQQVLQGHGGSGSEAAHDA